MIELDVQLTSDRHLIVLHDRELGRTVAGQGAVRERSLAELRALDAGIWFGRSYEGLRVPSLEDVLEQTRGRAELNVEIKSPASDWAATAEVLVEMLRRHRRPYQLQIVSRPKGETKFKPLPVRWVVERTYAWQGRYRCLSKDYEHTPEASEAMIRIAAVHHLLQRLRPKGKPYSQRFRFKKRRKTVG